MRVAESKVAIALFIAIPVLAGGAAIYYYTLPQPIASPSSSTASTTGAALPDGYQASNGQPQGSWARYLGYIPAGYKIAARSFNAPNFPCPPDMTSSQCSQFELSCGNGVCDPNESCGTCPIDCGSTGNLVCDPYTGRPGMPASVCQAMFAQNQGAVVG